MSRVFLSLLAIVALLAGANSAAAQQITVGTPLIGIHHGFFEHFNIGWGFRTFGPRGSTFFQFGGPHSAIPPFGGFDPSAGARFGLARRWGNGEFFFNFAAAQGRRSSLTMTAPSLTLTNGMPGFIQDATFRPFVTGLVPVVGGYPMHAGYPLYPGYLYPAHLYPAHLYPGYMHPGFPMGGSHGFGHPAAAGYLKSYLNDKLERLRSEPPRPGWSVDARGADADAELVLGSAGGGSDGGVFSPRHFSTAERGDISVGEIRRRQAAEDAERQRELDRLIDEGRAAERRGQQGIARVRYQQAAFSATGELREALLGEVARLREE